MMNWELFKLNIAFNILHYVIKNIRIIRLPVNYIGGLSNLFF